MAVIKSNHTCPLGLPRGPVVDPGKSVKVDLPGYGRFLRLHTVGSAWLAAGVIEIVEGEEQATAPDDEGGDGDQPKTASEVLAMVDAVHFQTFKAEAIKVLGDGAPSKKEEIIAALEERATAPE